MGLKIEAATKGIYKSVNSDAWYDSQEVQFIKSEDYFGYYVKIEPKKNFKMSYYQEVLPINNTLINKFGWQLYKTIKKANSLSINNQLIVLLSYCIIFGLNIIPKLFYFLKQKVFK